MDYFIKYKKAKLALLKIVCQFYSIKLTKKEIEELNLNCNQCDKTDDFDCVDLIYHGSLTFSLAAYLWSNKLFIITIILFLVLIVYTKSTKTKRG